MSRRVSVVLLAAALALPTTARASNHSKPAPSPALATELLARDFRLVPTLADLPASVRLALDSYTAKAPIADPGQPWDATKVSNPPRPRHRLRLTGYTDGAAFVLYEHAGRKAHDHLVLMGVKDGVLAVTYDCHVDARGKVDLPKLRALARTGCEPAGEHGEMD